MEMFQNLYDQPYLPKWTFPNQGVDFISVHPFLSGVDYVIMVYIIITIIKNTFRMYVDLALFGATFITMTLCPSLFLCIVNLKE